MIYVTYECYSTTAAIKYVGSDKAQAFKEAYQAKTGTSYIVVEEWDGVTEAMTQKWDNN